MNSPSRYKNSLVAEVFFLQTHCALLSKAADIFVKSMLHRHLFFLQRFTAALFDALIAANAVNATLSRQDHVNVVERLHTNYNAAELNGYHSIFRHEREGSKNPKNNRCITWIIEVMVF